MPAPNDMYDCSMPNHMCVRLFEPRYIASYMYSIYKCIYSKSKPSLVLADAYLGMMDYASLSLRADDILACIAAAKSTLLMP